MIYTENTKKAIKLAYQKHDGQFDKSGLPYVLHPFHLAEQMDDEDSTIVALLHDLIEDTDVTLKELYDLGFSKNVIDAIGVLTHSDGSDYYDYIERISNNEIATKVKIADLRHNSDLTRLNKIETKDLERIKKYIKSLEILEKKVTSNSKSK